MAETRHQSLVELNKQFEEVRVNSLRQVEDTARHFEEQRLHRQNLEKQMLEMKEILISMVARDRIPASSSKDQHKGTRCEQLAVNENSFCSAHQVFDETPKSANTIEVVQIDESSEDGGKALFEIVGWIKRDEKPSQILVPNEPNSAKESSVLVAHQVLDEMSKPKEFHNLELSEELRTFATLLDCARGR